jgi:hypothetical protein
MPDDTEYEPWQSAFMEVYQQVCGGKVYFIKELGNGKYQISFDGGSIGGWNQVTRAEIERQTEIFRRVLRRRENEKRKV